MRTMADLEAEARDFLQDRVSPYRHPADELIRYYKDAVSEMRRLRADIFIAPGRGLPYRDAFSGNFPLPDCYFRPVALFIAGSASLKDDEYVDVKNSRAATFLADFENAIKPPATFSALAVY